MLGYIFLAAVFVAWLAAIPKVYDIIYLSGQAHAYKDLRKTIDRMKTK